MVFKRGAAPKEVVNAAEQTGDLEKSGSGGDSVDPGAAQATDKEHEQAADALPVATDVFSWQGVTYDVMVKGNSRRLLSNVNGFVAPGRMTALMGESGAGKSEWF